MEKQDALRIFIPDLPPSLSYCAIFALVQTFLWQKNFTYVILVL